MRRGRPTAGSSCRERIVTAVEADPGVVAQELARRLGCRRSTVDYHTRELVRERRIEMERFGRMRGLFAPQVPVQQRAHLFWARRGRNRDVWAFAAAHPEASHAAIGRVFGLSRSRVSRLLRVLRAQPRDTAAQ